MTERHMKRCSTSLIVRKMQIKTTRRYITLPPSEWLLSKRQQRSTGKDVEKRGLACTAGETVNRCIDRWTVWSHTQRNTTQPKKKEWDFPGGSAVKRIRLQMHTGLIPGLGRRHMPQGKQACAPQLGALNRDYCSRVPHRPYPTRRE